LGGRGQIRVGGGSGAAAELRAPGREGGRFWEGGDKSELEVGAEQRLSLGRRGQFWEGGDKSELEVGAEQRLSLGRLAVRGGTYGSCGTVKVEAKLVLGAMGLPFPTVSGKRAILGKKLFPDLGL